MVDFQLMLWLFKILSMFYLSQLQSEKALQNWLEQELEVAVRVHEVRSAYEKQMAE
jgi:hypothetical protein